MKVRLEPHTAMSPSGNQISYPQDRIIVDDMEVAGYIGHAAHCKVCLIQTYNDEQQHEIARQVAELRKQDAVDVTPRPNVPPELLKTDEETLFNDDDFDS